MATSEQRIRSFFTSWFITDPVIFAVVNTHTLVRNDKIKSVRIGNRAIEYNEKFIAAQSEEDLKSLLTFESFRILLKHPYERAKPNPIGNFTGSNVTIQEYLSTHLEMPQAKEMFSNLLKKNRTKDQEKFLEAYDNLKELSEDELQKMTGLSPTKLEAIKHSIPNYDEEDLNKRHFEFYYNLIENNLPELIEEEVHFESIKEQCQQALGDGEGKGEEGKGEDGDGEGKGEDGDGSATDSKDHFDPANALEQQQNWGQDNLAVNEINDVIQKAQISNNWGTIPGNMRDELIASMKPKLDYRSILRQFRASILSSTTRANRMRPSRRFGFGFPGRKRDFTTSLAWYVDVSGSVDDEALMKCYSTINRFFKYGIESVDVYQFDTKMKSHNPMNMDKAKKAFTILGRGGTDFQCVFDDLETKPAYDGVIIYTDGYAPRPNVKKSPRTKNVLWLFDSEPNYISCKKTFKGLGRAAFIKSEHEV